MSDSNGSDSPFAHDPIEDNFAKSYGTYQEERSLDIEEDANAAAQGDVNNRVQDLDASRQGLHNLSVAVMDPSRGKERSLKFQWARLHPATVIACAEDNNSPIVELSRKFHEYQDAASQRKEGKVVGQDEKVYRPALLTASNVTIDLCELLPDPPLMSELVDAMFDDD
jgi:hypothetical protein